MFTPVVTRGERLRKTARASNACVCVRDDLSVLRKASTVRVHKRKCKETKYTQGLSRKYIRLKKERKVKHVQMSWIRKDNVRMENQMAYLRYCSAFCTARKYQEFTYRNIIHL